jgi:hypothetical protein
MLLRMFGGALLAGWLIFGSFGVAGASINNTSIDSQSQGIVRRRPKAVPEFDAAGVSALLLSGGPLLWYEYRRRRNKQKK